MYILFEKSLKAVADCPEATQTEKSLAELGLKAGADLMTDKESVQIRAQVLTTITGALAGPVGVVIAQAAKASPKPLFPTWGCPATWKKGLKPSLNPPKQRRRNLSGDGSPTFRPTSR